MVESASKGAVLVWSKELILASALGAGLNNTVSGMIAGAGAGVCQVSRGGGEGRGGGGEREEKVVCLRFCLFCWFIDSLESTDELILFFTFFSFFFSEIGHSDGAVHIFGHSGCHG